MDKGICIKLLYLITIQFMLFDLLQSQNVSSEVNEDDDDDTFDDNENGSSSGSLQVESDDEDLLQFQGFSSGSNLFTQTTDNPGVFHNKLFLVSLEIGKRWDDSLENNTTPIYQKYQHELEQQIKYVVGQQLLEIDFAYFRYIEDRAFIRCVFKMGANYPTKEAVEEKFESFLSAGRIRNLNIRRNRFIVRDISIEELQQNSHKPIFESCSSYKPMIMESQPIGTYVFRAKANDADPLEFGGTITYSIVSADESLDSFSIDNITGIVNTKIIFDRDEPVRNQDMYITVRATDNGKPQLNTVCTTKIKIMDINDNSPAFTKDEYEWSIPENFTLGQTIVIIPAIDIDEGKNGSVMYWLDSHQNSRSDVTNFFVERISGAIKLKKEITMGQYFFRVFATDIGTPPKSSSTNVTITVVNASMEAPSFDYHPNTITISQSRKLSIPIVNISAKSNSVNDDKIIFELLKGSTQATNKYATFILETVGENVASIKRNRNLDNETVPVYKLTIIGSNTDGLSAETKISVIVTNGNEEKPYFLDVGPGCVLENEPAGSSVIQVKALGMKWSSSNTILTYRLDDYFTIFYTKSHFKREKNVNNFFAIDRYTGQIKTMKTFDREQEPLYQVTVVVQDHWSRKSNIALIIEIKDKNDNPPIFEQQYYHAEVDEDSYQNSKVIDIEATDKDSVAVITYDITEGNERKAFFIESKNSGGVVRLKNVLDKNVREYNLTIRAFDSLYDDYATLRIKLKEIINSLPSAIEFEYRRGRIEPSQDETTHTDCIYSQNCLIPERNFNTDFNCSLDDNDPDFIHLSSTRLNEIIERFNHLDWERRLNFAFSLLQLKSDVCLFFQPPVSWSRQTQRNMSALREIEKDASEILVRILRETAKICNSDERKCKFCKGTDGYGNSWKICQGEMATQNCPDASWQSEYASATWNCPNNSTKFEGETPNYRECRSKFQNELPSECFQCQGVQFKPDDIKKGILFLKEVVTQDQKINGTFNYFGYEIVNISNLAVEGAQLTNGSNYSFLEVKNATKDSLTIIASLLANKEQWRQLPQNVKHEVATSVLKDLESTATVLTKKGKNFNETMLLLNMQVNHDEPGMKVIMGSEVSKPHQDRKLHFSDKRAGQESSISVKIPGNILNLTDEETIEYVGSMILMDYVENILNVPVISPGENETDTQDDSKRMNGKMISFKVAGFSSLRFEGENVRLVFAHSVPAIGEAKQIFLRKLHPGEIGKAVLGETTCAFLDENKLKWSTEGCRRVSSESDMHFTTCICKHLTSFAVLTGFHEYAGKNHSLQMLTWILCPISMICLFITIVILCALKALRTEQRKITVHLCITLLFGNCLLLLADKDNFYMPEAICTTFGVFSHYIWLCAFGWMGIGGIHLYQQVVKVFRSGKSVFKIYCLIAYGIPLLIVGATIGIGFALEQKSVYSGEMFCWLRGNYIWAFMGPVILVLSWNLGIFIKALLIACNLRKSKLSRTDVQVQEKQEHKTNLRLIKGSISLSIILGLTWTVGFFTMVDFPASHVLAYIFTILNASQGICIFIFNCCLDKTIRSDFSKVLSENIPTVSWSSPPTTHSSSFRHVRSTSRRGDRTSMYM